MRLGEVVGRVWAERQLDGLGGRTFVSVQVAGGLPPVVALDLIGAGVGSQVLVVTGEPAYRIADGAPVDAVVTAIVRQDDSAAG